VSPALEFVPAAEGFLDPERVGADDPASARAVVIPFGLEASVSYGSGTAAGPAAIVAASRQLELYDDELEREPYLDFGIATLREPEIAAPIEAALAQLAGMVEAVAAQGKFPLVLGGEHALTPGAIRPLVARHPGLVVLQFDAHADLRDGYLGERLSHAAAMRRVLDLPGVSLLSVGIRAISTAEVEFARANRDRIAIHWAKDRARWDVAEIVRPLRGRPVYVTFDVDVLDAAVMPATGTPTPGGLSYAQAIALLRAACEEARVVGADLVELAPIPGLHACDYTAAALAHKLLAYTLGSRRRAQ
jgi:agmatinase